MSKGALGSIGIEQMGAKSLERIGIEQLGQQAQNAETPPHAACEVLSELPADPGSAPDADALNRLVMQLDRLFKGQQQ
eukprot:4715133-Pyramimonas_sp.AAC.1